MFVYTMKSVINNDFMEKQLKTASRGKQFLEKQILFRFLFFKQTVIYRSQL